MGGTTELSSKFLSIIKTEIKSFRSEDQSVLQEQLKIYNSALEYFEKNGYNKKSYEEKFDVAVSKINIYINLIGVYFNCKLNNGEIYFDKNLRKDVVLNLDEEYLNRVKLPGNKLRWSQQLRCRLDMGLTEEPIVYLPAMYLAKQDSIKKIKDLLKDIKFIDKIDDNQEVKAKDITIEKLNKLSKLNELFQKEELPSYDNLIYEYFSSLYEIPYYRESEQPKADTSNYTRKFFTDIEHLNELVPLFYTPNETNEGTANPPKDSDTAKKLKAEKDQQAKERHRKIINQLCKHVDLAKFFYIYRSYYIWKANQYNKDGSINPNAKICNINNLDKSNLESQPILHMIIYGRSYKVEDRRSTSNTEKDTATAENTLQKEDISLGTLAGLSNAHGEYFDELYTLYYINSTIDYKDAIFMNIFWRSMTLSEYQLMTSSYCTRLHRELYDATDVLIRNSYDSDSRNIPMPPLPLKILQETCKMIANEYLSRKFFLSQLPNLSPGIVPMTFLYNSHLEKKLELLNRLREVVEDAISGAWQPRQEDIDELAMAIVNNTYGFLTYFKKIIKNTRDIFPSNEKLLKEIDEKGNKLTEDDYKILYQFIYGSTEPTDRQKIEAAKNIHSLLPFLVDYTYFFPPTVDNPECKIQMWVYYACIGLYMLSTILTQENIKNHSLELVRKTFDSTEAKYQRIDKFTLTDLVKSKSKNSTKPFYQLLYPYEGNSSYYEKYHFLFDFDLLNILDCNQRAISPLRLNSSKDSKLTQLQNGIALLNSMAVYTLLTSCSLLYDFFPILPDSLRNNILDSLTEINKFTHEDRLFLNNYLKKQYFPDDTESRVGEYYRTNDNADKFHVARVVKYTCHLR